MLAGPSRPATAKPYVIPPFWQALANCETGGLWDWGKFAHSPLRRPKEGSTYEGGVGFYWGTWQEWARDLGVKYRHAWQAPVSVQVRVARYGLNVKRGYWGCLHGTDGSYISSLPGR